MAITKKTQDNYSVTFLIRINYLKLSKKITKDPNQNRIILLTYEKLKNDFKIPIYFKNFNCYIHKSSHILQVDSQYLKFDHTERFSAITLSTLGVNHSSNPTHTSNIILIYINHHPGKRTSRPINTDAKSINMS